MESALGIFNFSVFLNATYCENGECRIAKDSRRMVIFSWTSVMTFCIIYLIIFVVGATANITVLLLMVCRGMAKRGISLYVFNLSICDLLILLFYVPTEMLYTKNQFKWKMGAAMCKVVNIILPVTLTCTIGTLLAIAFDRAYCVIRPSQWRVESFKRAKIALPIIWIISILINFPLLIHPKLERGCSVQYCSEGWPDPKEGENFWMCMFALVFCLPLVTIMITYLYILCSISRQNRFRKNQSGVNKPRNKRMIIMCVNLVILFTICTGFQHFLFFISSRFSRVKLTAKTLSILYVVSNLFVSLQAAINPFIYGKMHGTITCRGAGNDNRRSTTTSNVHLFRIGGQSRHEKIDSPPVPDSLLDEANYPFKNCSKSSSSSFSGSNKSEKASQSPTLCQPFESKWRARSPLSEGSNYLLDIKAPSQVPEQSSCVAGNTGRWLSPLPERGDFFLSSKEEPSPSLLFEPHDYSIRPERCSRSPLSEVSDYLFSSKERLTPAFLDPRNYLLERKWHCVSPLCEGSGYLLSNRGSTPLLGKTYSPVMGSKYSLSPFSDKKDHSLRSKKRSLSLPVDISDGLPNDVHTGSTTGIAWESI